MSAWHVQGDDIAVAAVHTQRDHGRCEPSHERTPRAAVVLLGTGVVGGAFLKLLDTPAAASLQLVGVANSRCQQLDPDRLGRRDLRRRLAAGDGAARDDGALVAALARRGAQRRVIVDATASHALAACHARWLAQGCHVVTANKAAIGADLGQWHGIQDARRAGASQYGDAATVGAGLPVLATLHRLHACGDALLQLEGVFSGSLGWLFGNYDGSVPFSRLLRRARELGYSEPDPRADLSGRDVARKLLILARAAGLALAHDAVAVEDMVPPAMRHLAPAAFLDRAGSLDEVFAARLAEARRRGGVLRHIARLDADGAARVGLAIVAPGHPAASLAGTDNLFALTTTRYRGRPLVIRGPGAGAEVTAQALLGDILALPCVSRFACADPVEVAAPGVSDR